MNGCVGIESNPSGGGRRGAKPCGFDGCASFTVIPVNLSWGMGRSAKPAIKIFSPAQTLG